MEGDFPEYAYPTAATLELKPGAQVMFIRNDGSAEKRYFNGKIGEITGMSQKAVEVRCPGEAGIISVEPTTWENITYSVDPTTAEISQKIIGTFSQYPLKLAWAITIHKSQGLTFDRAIIDAEAAFAHGQVYVALSRCRTFEGLVLSSPLSVPALKADQAIRRFTAETAGQKPPRQTLAVAKGRYQQQLLLDCFSFERLGSLLGRLAVLLRSNAQVIQTSGAEAIPEAQRQTYAEICTVGQNFKRQLQGLFNADRLPADDPVICERLFKATVYFQNKFDEVLSPCLENLSFESDNKEIRKKINNTLKLLREEAAVKLAGIKSCREGFSPAGYLRALSAAAISAGLDAKKSKPETETRQYTEADIGHPELFQDLRQWRNRKAAEENLARFQVLHQKTLVQIAVHLPDTLDALKKIKGIGERLAQRYGRELTAMVAAYRNKHGITEVFLPEPTRPEPPSLPPSKPEVKEDTKKVSLELFEHGLTIAQIASRRGLTAATIEAHMAHFVSRGHLEIDKLVASEKRCAIEKKIAEASKATLKVLKTDLGSDYSYGEIKLVLAHLRHLEQKCAIS